MNEQTARIKRMSGAGAIPEDIVSSAFQCRMATRQSMRQGGRRPLRGNGAPNSCPSS